MIAGVSQGFRDKLGLLYSAGVVTLPATTNITTNSYSIKKQNSTVFAGHKERFLKIEALLKQPLFLNSSVTKYLPTLGLNLQIQCKKGLYLIEKYLGLFRDINSESVNTDENSILINKDNYFPGIEQDSISALYESLQDKEKFALIDTSAGDIMTDYGINAPLEQTQIINYGILLLNSINSYNNELQLYIDFIREVRDGSLSYKNREEIKPFLGISGNESNVEILSARVKNYASNPSKITFDITYILQIDDQNFVKYKNIPLNGYILNKTFYSSDLTSEIFTLNCKEKICTKVFNTTCSKNLIAGSIYDIIKSCPFQIFDKEFEITSFGILIYKLENDDLIALLKTQQLTVDTFPSLVRFRDCFEIENHGIKQTGCLDFNKEVITSLYANANVDFLLHLKWYTQILYMMTNYPLVVLISVIAATLFISMTIFKAFFTCCYKSCCKKKSKYQPVKTNSIQMRNKKKRDRTSNATRRSRD